MKQIEYVNLPKLRTDEVFGFLSVVAQTTSLVTVEADQPCIELFKGSVSAFDNVLKPDASSPESKSRQEADQVADDTWRGLQMQAEAMTRFPNPATQQIALKVYAIIEKYGQLNKMPYDEEYANMKGLLEEIKKLPQADLESTGLKIWVDALQVAYDNFQIASVEKNKAEGEKETGIVAQRRQEAEQAYTDMTFRINCGAGYNGDEPYAAFIDALNAQIHERKATLSARTTRAANKKEEENK